MKLLIIDKGTGEHSLTKGGHWKMEHRNGVIEFSSNYECKEEVFATAKEIIETKSYWHVSHGMVLQLVILGV